MKTFRVLTAMAATVAILGLACAAHAEQYPSQTIKIVVPFGAGGVTDLVARPIAQQLTQELGQPVIVENRPGASGTIGANAVAKSKPDGYTVLLSSRAAFAANAYLFAKLPYDPIKDFTPLTLALGGPGYLLVVGADSPIKSIQDLVATAKKEPGKLSYGAPGQGVSSTMELFSKAAGIQLLHVPYKSSAEVVTAVLGGQVELTAMLISEASRFLEQGKVRALAIASPKRARALPNLPTLEELGYPDVDSDGYFAMWFPAGTPQDRVDTLYKAVKKALETPQLRQSMAQMGYEVVASPPSDFAAFIAKDIAAQKSSLERAGLKPQ